MMDEEIQNKYSSNNVQIWITHVLEFKFWILCLICLFYKWSNFIDWMVSVIDNELECQFLNLYGLGCLLTWLLKMVDFTTCNTEGNEKYASSFKT